MVQGIIHQEGINLRICSSLLIQNFPEENAQLMFDYMYQSIKLFNFCSFDLHLKRNVLSRQSFKVTVYDCMCK